MKKLLFRITGILLMLSVFLCITAEASETDIDISTTFPDQHSEFNFPYQANDSGDVVLMIQNRLRDFGYIPDVTGEYDNKTTQAVLAFQIAIGLPATGIVDIVTFKMMYPELQNVHTSTPTPTPTPRPIPQTGDNNHPALWGGLILLGFTGLALLVIKASAKKNV